MSIWCSLYINKQFMQKHIDCTNKYLGTRPLFSSPVWISCPPSHFLSLLKRNTNKKNTHPLRSSISWAKYIRHHTFISTQQRHYLLSSWHARRNVRWKSLCLLSPGFFIKTGKAYHWSISFKKTNSILGGKMLWEVNGNFTGRQSQSFQLAIKTNWNYCKPHSGDIIKYGWVSEQLHFTSHIDEMFLQCYARMTL